MERNVGGYDRIARFVVGPVLIVVGAATLAGLLSLAAGTVGVALAAVALVVGAVLTVTAVTQKCPLNRVVGMNTYRAESDRSSSEEPEASAR
jgi:NAD/NADP transhydrogenase alpha subunit